MELNEKLFFIMTCQNFTKDKKEKARMKKKKALFK